LDEIKKQRERQNFTREQNAVWMYNRLREAEKILKEIHDEWGPTCACGLGGGVQCESGAFLASLEGK